MSRDELAALGVVESDEPAPEMVEVVEDRPFREESETPPPAVEPAPESEPLQEVGLPNRRAPRRLEGRRGTDERVVEEGASPGYS